MKKIIPFIIAALISTPVLAEQFSSPFESPGVYTQERPKGLTYGYGWHRGPGWGHRPYHHDGSAIVGGVIGGMIGSWLFKPEPPPPPPVPELAPWSANWYTYCGQKYQTFDPKTGYYVGEDGQRYFCQ